MTIAGSAASNGTHIIDAESGHAVAPREDLGYETLYFLFLSLVLGAAARGAVRGSRLPYTVALLFLGLALGFLHAYVDLGVLGNSLDVWVEIGPHTMLSCFLPALVFESAFSLEWHTFRRCAAQVLWLAGPGVLVGTALMGALLKVTLPYGWGWPTCLMLGSILSATDPVAVVALLKEVGASKRLGHIIEGESLVNDGTAIVVFSLLNEIAKGFDKTPLEICSFFVWVPVGAVLVGLGIAAGCHAWLGLGAVAGDHLVQISVTLFACYLCFLVAEFQAAASGVLAVVVLGVAIGAFGRGFFTGETEHSLHHFWEMLTFAANTVLFILTGVIIAETTVDSTVEGTLIPSDLGWGVVVYFEVIFARVVVVGLLFPILTRCGYGLTPADAAVCVWGGLRGAVGLALALVVSEESAAYSDAKVGPVVLLCTGVVVVLTLSVNGTTTAFLLQWLGLTRPEVSVQVAVRKARRHIREQCLAVYHEHLTTSDDVMGTADFRAVSDLVPFLAAVEDVDTPDNNNNDNNNGGNGGGLLSRNNTALVHGGGSLAGSRGSAGELDTSGFVYSAGEGIEMHANHNLRANRHGLMTPAPSIADLASFGHQAEQLEAAAGALTGAGAGDGDGAGAGAGAGGSGSHSQSMRKNVLGQFGSGPDLSAAVAVAVKKDFEDMVAVWQRDVRGRFLAHLKVLYWEALEVGRATKVGLYNLKFS
jgi:NhaP-type Na+/H+ or K+/H+ antiporter